HRPVRRGRGRRPRRRLGGLRRRRRPRTPRRAAGPGAAPRLPLRMPVVDVWNDLFNAQLTIAGHTIAWREVVGNAFGLASAVLGMRRTVWAWPVGIIGNALLFTVFMGVWFANPQEHSLFGQAARQVFFILTSVYGWWAWNRSRRGRAHGAPAITPRWATAAERAA